MANSEPTPWRDRGGVEGRAARVAEIHRLASEGLDAGEIAVRMAVAEWIVRRDLDTVGESKFLPGRNEVSP
ncbi:MAG: hypothetical protein NVSMB25_09330 [Thermoleophilaceae bacterium]